MIQMRAAQYRMGRAMAIYVVTKISVVKDQFDPNRAFKLSGC